MLKLHVPNLHFDEVLEEQILYFGKIPERIINRNKTFRHLRQAEVLAHIKYTDAINSDFIYFPQKIYENCNIDNLISTAKECNKYILLFSNDDSDSVYNFDRSIIFRTSIYKSTKPTNYLSLPAFCNDLRQEAGMYLFRKKSDRPVIGFCGAITHPARAHVLNAISNCTKVDTNFIVRGSFWGGKPWDNDIRQEYINNTLNSDFVMCVRGAGNFSYRLYETLCLGRVPLVLESDMCTPFEEFLDYSKIILVVKDISNIEGVILDYYNKIDNFIEHQQMLRYFWEDHLSPIGFIRTLDRHKEDIKKLIA